jgi:hypothetical protein
LHAGYAVLFYQLLQLLLGKEMAKAKDASNKKERSFHLAIVVAQSYVE